MTAHLHDLLVVGGGPAGSATAYWAARSGLDVVVVEKIDRKSTRLNSSHT